MSSSQNDIATKLEHSFDFTWRQPSHLARLSDLVINRSLFFPLSLSFYDKAVNNHIHKMFNSRDER